jgi:arylsulfatase A-like enzyme
MRHASQKDITRRDFLVGAFAAALPILVPRIALPGSTSRPNIIVFLLDDWRWDCLGFLGHPHVKTPSIDAIAAESVVFSNAFVTTSICACSRASILTGQTIEQHGVHNMGVPLPPTARQRIYPTLLRNAGYYTGFIGKWGIGGSLPTNDFDYWDGFAGLGEYFHEGREHLTDRQGESILKFLRTAREPFLLMAHFKAPHWPSEPQPRFAKLYETAEISRPPTAGVKHFISLPEALRRSQYAANHASRMATDAQYLRYLRAYYALITGADAIIGTTADALRQSGVAERTTLLVTSDNGLMLGEHNLVGKSLMYEESIRIPMILRLAESLRGPSPRTVTQFALNIDIAPTILQMCGVPSPLAMRGTSLLEAIANPTTWRKYFLYTFPRRPQPCSGVRTLRWKYTLYGGPRDHEELLFDIENDPREERNLASEPEHQANLIRLRQRTAELLESEQRGA